VQKQRIEALDCEEGDKTMAEQAVIWKAEADTVLNVRPDMESGGEPFVRIMEAVTSIKPGGTLVIITPFEPVPLYDVLGERGFSHETVRIAADKWADEWIIRIHQGESEE
jgi:Uncharacterized conserved protein (DUF2249)